jgi:bacteriocin-like protein
MTNEPRRDIRNPVPVVELTEDQLKQVSGGVPRDAASGLPSGQRMHRPFVLSQY